MPTFLHFRQAKEETVAASVTSASDHDTMEVTSEKYFFVLIFLCVIFIDKKFQRQRKLC
jgi:hypothetical protein